MKIDCDIVLTADLFDDRYAQWKERSLTVMGDSIKVHQYGLEPKYFDTIYLFEEPGLMIGFKYGEALSECYITTKDGLCSEPFADAFPYIFKDMDRYYAVVKKCYRNIDLRKNVIGLNIINAKNLSLLYNKLTWPLWESIESIHHGAVVIKKGDSMYGMATIDKFPTCNLVNMAYSIKRDQEEDAVYYIQKSDSFCEIQKIDITKKLDKIKLKP